MPKINKRLEAELALLGACHEGQKWGERQENAQAMWEKCTNASWMVWWLIEMFRSLELPDDILLRTQMWRGAERAYIAASIEFFAVVIDMIPRSNKIDREFMVKVYEIGKKKNPVWPDYIKNASFHLYDYTLVDITQAFFRTVSLTDRWWSFFSDAADYWPNEVSGQRAGAKILRKHLPWTRVEPLYLRSSKKIAPRVLALQATWEGK